MALAAAERATRELVATLANGLAARGRHTTLVWASEHTERTLPPPPVAPGVEVVVIKGADPQRPPVPNFPLLNLTRQIAPKLREFEIVYGLVSGHPTMHAVRERRFLAVSPYFVAVVDRDPSEHRDWSLTGSATARRFSELYVLQHSDLIVYLGAAHPEHLANLGVAPSASRMLRSDIEKMQALFDDVETRARTVVADRAEREDCRIRALNSSLTVCVSHSAHTSRAARALQAFDRQTRSNFSIIAVDSSTSAEFAASFAQLADQYRGRGWTFRHEPHAGEARAIARAVEHVSSNYLMFIDADDEPAPCLVERVLEAAEQSGDHLLEIWSSEAADPDDLPLVRDNRGSSLTGAIHASYGIDLIATMAGNGDSKPVFVLRRATFEAVGGYPQALVAGRERQTLAARVVLAGYATDVLPEILNTRHLISAGALHDAIVEGEAVRSAFDERLRMINMQSFAMAFQSVAQQALEAEQEVAMRRRELTQRFAARSVRDRLRLLMVISSFPYPPITGCYQRWWAMIRFLGQRHDLTLVTFCSSEQSRLRHELLRYCRSVYAAGYGGDKLPEEEGMPYLVRERMRVTMRDALRAVPSDLYDAALIEQIVLAPFRVEINAPAILGEHNIELRLLTQAAQIDLRSPPPAHFSNSQSKSKLLRDYEDRVWPEFAVRTAVNPHERDEIQRRSKTGRTILVENGANPDLWLPDVRPGTDRIVFFGNLGYYPNIDGVLHFWQDIWPHIIRRRPSLELIVAGSAATSELRELAQQPGFILVEDPPDIRDVAILASVSIVPLRLGGGTRLKILNSMALGLPVVSTSLGCEGLTIENDEHLLVRDDAVEFAEAVEQLLGSLGLWQRLRQNGKVAIEELYTWDKVLAPLESALWSLSR